MKKIKQILDKIPSVYKTFAWNVFYQALTAGVNWALANFAQLNIPAEYAVLVGLILSAISKYLATKK